jgi:hypothetical protein
MQLNDLTKIPNGLDPVNDPPIETNGPFETSDYGLAAYFWTLGIEPLRVERRGQEVVFVYTLSQPLMLAINGYLKNREVRVRDYFNALRKAKATIQDIMRTKDTNNKCTPR